MKFEVEALPYAQDALAPAMSAETFSYHYEKHHKGYMKKLEAAIGGKPEADKSLEEIIASSEGGVFNCAAQVWNHTFFWKSMKPSGGGAPAGDLAALLTRDFGGVDKFLEEFKTKSAGQFGSGWGWLVLEGGKGKVVTTGNAGTPLTAGQTPLLTIDVWEHAYYIDHRNDRGGFIQVYLDKLVNWDFAAANLAAAK